MMVVACGSDAGVVPHDGAAGAAGTMDASTDTMVGHPGGCRALGTTCDGLNKNVLACVGNQPGEILEACTEACSFGRCTSTACAGVESRDALRGCRFYGVQMDNVDSDDAKNLMLILGNDLITPASVVVKTRGLTGTWEMLTSAKVPGRGGARILINRPASASGLTVSGAFRVDSDSPVLATEIVSGDADRMSRSSGGTTLRPVQALGLDHIAVTFPQKASPDVLQTTGSRGGAGAITVVATAPATKVSIGLAGSVMVDSGGLIDPQTAMPQDIAMDEGDVLQIFSSESNGDLTGTTVHADAPIAVFTGNVYTTYGYDVVTGLTGGDLAMEELPAISSWGVEYVGARLLPEAGCDSWFGDGSGLWSVVAAADTTVTLTPAAGVSIDSPDIHPGVPFQLARGQALPFFMRADPGSSARGDFTVKAPEPILLAQWLDCQPGLSWGIDARMVTGDLAFTLPPGFEHEVVVVRKNGISVNLDGAVIQFTSTIDGTKYELARLSASDLGVCRDLDDPCEHVLSGAEFGVSWRGIDVVCSYALTVPTSDHCALTNQGCVR